jgi:c-di-GMP-binding flagellar brake protein YcgR
MSAFVLGNTVELELAGTKRFPAWTIRVDTSHVWIELHGPAAIRVGERVKLVGVGDDGAAWCLDTEVAEVRDPDGRGIPIVKVIETGRRDPVQRREYFRVSSTLAVVLAVTASPDPERVIGELVAVTTVDLSGGGLQLETDRTLVVGDSLELSLALPTRMIHVSGMVTRVTAADPTGALRAPGRGAVFLVGVELGSMLERDRAELVTFVHHVERKLRSTRRTS